MRIRFIIAGLLLLGLTFVSCSSSNFVTMTGEARPPIPVSEVRTYSKFPEKYDEIAIIYARQPNNWGPDTSTKGLIKELTEKAAELGANGIVYDLKDLIQPGYGHMWFELPGTAIYVPDKTDDKL